MRTKAEKRLTPKIADRCETIIREHLRVSEHKKIDDFTTIEEDLGADSLDAVEMVMAFEEEFDYQVPDKDAEELTSFGKIVRYIKSHVRHCRICECTENRACPGGCSWSARNVCSNCVGLDQFKGE